MRVGEIDDSTFLSLIAIAAWQRPDIAGMYRPSFRMILFIATLAAGHMAAMPPPSDSSLHRPPVQMLTKQRPTPPGHLGAPDAEPPPVSTMARAI